MRLRLVVAMFFVILALVGFAGGAGSATLTVVPNKTSYSIGETITLTITGDSQGAEDKLIFGRLLYEAALTSTVSSSQITLTSDGVPWNTGPLSVGDGFATVFNQLVIPLSAPVDQLLIATATLIAEAPGTVHVSWESTFGVELDFFGLNNSNVVGTQATFTIPEPTVTALLQIAGLLGLAAHTSRCRL
jgi:hypothetical protein